MPVGDTVRVVVDRAVPPPYAMMMPTQHQLDVRMGLNQLLVQSLSNPAESPRLVHVAVETEYRVMPGVTGEYGIRPRRFLPPRSP